MLVLAIHFRVVTYSQPCLSTLYQNKWRVTSERMLLYDQRLLPLFVGDPKYCRSDSLIRSWGLWLLLHPNLRLWLNTARVFKGIKGLEIKGLPAPGNHRRYCKRKKCYWPSLDSVAFSTIYNCLLRKFIVVFVSLFSQSLSVSLDLEAMLFFSPQFSERAPRWG